MHYDGVGGFGDLNNNFIYKNWSKKMSNLSSEEDSNNSIEDS